MTEPPPGSMSGQVAESGSKGLGVQYRFKYDFFLVMPDKHHLRSFWSDRASGQPPIERPHKWRNDLLAIIFLILIVSLFHWRGLLPGRVFIGVDIANRSLPWYSPPQPFPHNWLLRDPVWQSYPFTAQSVARDIDDGAFLWNPRSFVGHPRLADPLAQPFYPVFHLLGRLLGAARGLTIGFWLHAVWASICVYGFLRTIGCKERAAVFGAIAYAIGGHLVNWFEYRNLMSTLSWLPAVLWAFELTLQKRQFRYLVLASVALAIAIYAGQFQYVATFVLFLGLYAIGHVLWMIKRGYVRDAYRPVINLLAIVALGLVMSAAILLPFIEFLNLSHRAIEQGFVIPYPTEQLLTLIVPDLFGNPTVTTEYWGSAYNYNENTIYAGVVTLLLAILAPFQLRRFSTVTISLIALLMIYIMIGGPGVGFLGSIPGIKYISQLRSIYILALLLAILAAQLLNEGRISVRGAFLAASFLLGTIILVLALNLNQVQTHWEIIRMPIIRAIVIIAGALALVMLRSQWPQRAHRIELGFVLLLFIDLFLWGSRYNPIGAIDDLYPQTPSINHLRETVGDYRVAALQTGSQTLYGFNILPMFTISDASGYSSLASSHYLEVVEAGDPKAEAPGVGFGLKHNRNIVFFSNPSQRLLDLLQVSHVVSPNPLSITDVSAELLAHDCTADSGEITRTNGVENSFTVDSTAINRLDLQFRVYDPDQASGSLAVRMWRGGNRQQLMLESRVESSSLQDEQIVPFYFAPEINAPGQTYVWEVSADETESGTGVGLCYSEGGMPSHSVYGQNWQETFNGEVTVYQHRTPMPRAYIVYKTEHETDKPKWLARLMSDSFDLRNGATTDVSVGLPTEASIPATPAIILNYDDTEVVIQATAHQDGLLVLGDLYYPGWDAYVDGQRSTVVRTNYIYRGVFLPAGEHEVVFKFAPMTFQVGLGISVAGLLIGLALLGRDLGLITAMKKWLKVSKSS